ncbi:MAG: GGDEF domain-containing protein [Lachnospiraceae bacterium]|nr:GGDEF domain-containing protein [Lachnospiraceae bacterium]
MAKRIAGIILACLGILAVIIVIMISVGRNDPEYDSYILNDGWSMRGSLSDKKGSGVYITRDEISVDRLPKPNKGDYVTISRLLPDMGEMPFPTLLFETKYCAYEVSVGGVVVARYDMDRIQSGSYIGKSYHFITLPDDYAGSYVTITLYRAENAPGNAISAPVIGSHKDLENMLVRKYFMTIGGGFFMLIFGMIFLFLTLMFLGKVPELMPQLVSSLFAVSLGISLICNDQTAFLFMSTDIASVAYYMALFAQIPIGLILLDTLQVEHRFSKKAFRIVVCISVALVFIMFTLHVTDIIHVNNLMNLFVVMLAGTAVLFGDDVARSIRNRRFSPVSAVTLTGMCAFILSSLVGVVVMMLGNAGLIAGEWAWRNLLSAGSLVFAASQIVNYMLFISESGNRQRDYAKLTNIAFADSLTGLANRAKADSVFEELDRSREDYCLVSVDVNGLKDTNDRLGHAAGDRLLKDYAMALKTSFGDEALCARMGGDEFLVVMKKTNADGFGARLRRLYGDLDEMNRQDRTIFRSAAIGYAFRHECHAKDAHSVYLLADERMFENKREQHVRYRIKDRE